MITTSGRPQPGGTVPRRAARATVGQDWRARAACRDAASLFYQSDLELKQATDHRVSKAKTVCARCPVRPQCAAYALKAMEPHGIWGGFTERERTLLRDTDWRRCANAQCTWVDVRRLQAQLSVIGAVMEEDHAPPQKPAVKGA
jgi:WhiB family transcriptional regulator, redox-sensing transcriptional regulator